MVAYLVELLEEDPFGHAPYVLDLGTGNGHLLFSLVEGGQEALPAGAIVAQRFMGVDYAAASIRLSKAIAEERGAGCEHVQFEQADLRDKQTVSRLVERANEGRGWDIVCDKGTVGGRAYPV